MESRTISIAALLTLLLIIAPKLMLGQTNQANRETFYWLRYAPSLKLSNSWKVKGEIELRRFMFPDRQHQLFLPRITILKQLPNEWDIGAGILYLRQSLPQNSDESINIVRPEIRPHQELTMKDSWANVRISHRYRLEERIKRKTVRGQLADGYNFNFRFRYRLQLAFPLNKKDGARNLLLNIYDEIMFNFGGTDSQNTFGQNRVSLALEYILPDHIGIEAGFITNFKQGNKGERYLNPYILRVTVSHFL